MIRWLRGLGGGRPEPLAGAPAHSRRKTYSADSGYVYQYQYRGYRVVSEDRGAARGTATEYVFEVSADRKTTFTVSVLVADDATGAWERTRERDLNSTERYAIAKMALFSAFDEREEPHLMHEAVWVDASSVEEILDTLGID